MPTWMVQSAKLDDNQQAIRHNLLLKKRGNGWIRGSDWIKGCAGTGKTVLLLHALNEIKILHPILVIVL